MFGGWDAPYCYNDLYILDMSKYLLLFSYVWWLGCPLLLAHLAKGNVSFCHHLASVVRLLFTFQSSPLKALSQMNQNLVESIY